MDRHTHWNDIYTRKQEDEVSWFEAPSCNLPQTAGSRRSKREDVRYRRGRWGLPFDRSPDGARSPTAWPCSMSRLHHCSGPKRDSGSKAGVPIWIKADVAGDWSLKPMDIWHDRAVFHFLTEAKDQRRYIDHLRLTLKSEGAVIIATFALEGPDSCSGLPVMRYSPDLLTHTLGADFELMESIGHVHQELFYA